jgi:hypothetical protein
MRGLYSVAIAIVVIAVASVSRAQDFGTPQCGGVQQAVQIAIGDENTGTYRNHGAYVSAVSALVNQALKGNLITGACPGCIVNQFARDVPVANQSSCGPVTVPTQICTLSNPTAHQVQTAAVLALSGLSDPWGDPAQFQSFLKSVDSILGCQVARTSSSSQSHQQLNLLEQQLNLTGQPKTPALGPQGVNYCLDPVQGVNYCGPGNSITNPILAIVNVLPCLNQGCFHHDTCYSTDCVAGECTWTPQSQTCDNDLVNICEGKVSTCPVSADQTSREVCDAVLCLNNSIPGVPQ